MVANDRSGFWNLEGWSGATQAPLETPNWAPLLTLEAEFAMPQWVFGMSTHTWDGTRLLAIACRQGRWELGEVTGASWQPIEQPCSDLAGLCAEAGQLTCIASRPNPSSGLLEVALEGGQWNHRAAAPARFPRRPSANPKNCGLTAMAASPPKPGTTRPPEAA